MGPFKNNLRKKLINLEPTIGSWITLAHPAIAEIMSRAGYDWLVIDLEHSVITIREAEELIRIVDLCNVSPLVRVSSNDPVQIKRVMDAGAHGVVVPMINSVEDAEAIVEAVKYPTKGRRGIGLARAQGYGNNFEQYVNWVDDAPIIITQIEHIDGVKNLKEILSINDVQGFIVGPYDLSGSIGVPGQFGHPDVKNAMEEISAIGKLSNKSMGIHIIEPNIKELNEKKEQGYNFIAYSLDIRMLSSINKTAIDSFYKNN